MGAYHFQDLTPLQQPLIRQVIKGHLHSNTTASNAEFVCLHRLRGCVVSMNHATQDRNLTQSATHLFTFTAA